MNVKKSSKFKLSLKKKLCNDQLKMFFSSHFDLFQFIAHTNHKLTQDGSKEPDFKHTRNIFYDRDFLIGNTSLLLLPISPTDKLLQLRIW